METIPDIKTKPIRLSWHEKEQQVFIEDQNEDRYFMTVGEAVLACGAHEQGKNSRCNMQFHQRLMPFLFVWLKKHHSAVERAFLTVQDHGLLFLVVTKSKHFESEFEDELTKLDLSVAQSVSFSEIDLSVQSLPSCDSDNYRSFCDSAWTIELLNKSKATIKKTA